MVQVISAHQVADFPLEQTMDSDNIAKGAGNNSGSLCLLPSKSIPAAVGNGATTLERDPGLHLFQPWGLFTTSLMHVSDCLVSLFSESFSNTAQRVQSGRDHIPGMNSGDIEIPFITLYSNSGVNGPWRVNFD